MGKSTVLVIENSNHSIDISSMKSDLDMTVSVNKRGEFIIRCKGLYHVIDRSGIVRTERDVDDSNEHAVATWYANDFGLSGIRDDETPEDFRTRIADYMAHSYFDYVAAKRIKSNSFDCKNKEADDTITKDIK